MGVLLFAHPRRCIARLLQLPVLAAVRHGVATMVKELRGLIRPLHCRSRLFAGSLLPYKWYLVGAFTGIWLLTLLLLGTGVRYTSLNHSDIRESLAVVAVSDPDNISRSLDQVQRRLAALRPRGYYIIIDRGSNHLFLMHDGEQILDALISTGSGNVLTEPGGKRQWVFDTPVGKFHIRNRRQDPLWVAPDWSFIEQNEPIPRNPADRIQAGTLGEYALDLNAPGYMIHGTLYSRLLGQNVSHGCIRVGRDDLRVLWKKAPLGTAVFIY